MDARLGVNREITKNTEREFLINIGKRKTFLNRAKKIRKY